MSITSLQTPQSRCRVGMARCDITPPVGIYHRMWGAALHDRATGIHRPLVATFMWLEPWTTEGTTGTDSARLIVSLDHCILDGAELKAISRAIQDVTGIDAGSVQITLTHTHGSGWMSRERQSLPGGELIGPYLDSLRDQLARSALDAQKAVVPATFVYGTGRCTLAAHRDFQDEQRGHAACGFHPEGFADDTVLVAQVVSETGSTLATIVNYACHPTTLAWDNTLISPDWVGAMRATVEQAAGGLCLFLQGASGDLGPKQGYVGDPAVADRNGRQLGYAVLSALESLSPAGTEYRYQGPVLSGTWIGTWEHKPLPEPSLAAHSRWKWKTLMAELPYRHDLPTIDETERSRDHWRQQEEEARSANDEARLRDCRANVEQMTRQLTRLKALSSGKVCPLPVSLARLGDAVWVFTPGELYQVFQTTLRNRFAPHPVIVTTMTGDWQPGYIPPADIFGYGLYQEVIAATSPGSLELLIETVTRSIRELLAS